MRPTLFTIGSFPVHSYGLLLVLGFMIGLQYARKVCERRMRTEPEGSVRRIDPDTIFDLGITGLVIGILGARLLFVVLDWGSFAKHPIDALKIWEGGLSLHGGMLAGILYLIWFCHKRKLSILAVGDICAPAWAIAYAVGRIGCLLNGCCYGGPCAYPWGVRFHDENSADPSVLTPPSHPTQLYATLFNLVFFFWLARWERKGNRTGELFYSYIAMYGFYRFVVEIFRAGATSTYLIPSMHLTDTHLISIFMMVVGLIGLQTIKHLARTTISRNQSNISQV